MVIGSESQIIVAAVGWCGLEEKCFSGRGKSGIMTGPGEQGFCV
jgi:hypothetical protein